MRWIGLMVLLTLPMTLPAVEVTVDSRVAQSTDTFIPELIIALKTHYDKIAWCLDGADTSLPPPEKVGLIFKEGKGVAHASVGNITVFLPYMRECPSDTGVVIHEAVHIIQRYPGGTPLWVTEGIADYVRFVKFEPNGLPDSVWKHEHYTNAYRVTARFFGWIETQYKIDLIRPLNKACRAGKYDVAIFRTLTGKTVDELWQEYARP